MARIYKTTDRIEIRLEDITVTVSPLSFQQKCEIQADAGKGGMEGMAKAAFNAIKYCVKEVSGLEDASGQPYKVDKDDKGYLTDECAEALMNMEVSEQLMKRCAELINAPDFSKDDVVSINGVKLAKDGKASSEEAEAKKA